MPSDETLLQIWCNVFGVPSMKTMRSIVEAVQGHYYCRWPSTYDTPASRLLAEFPECDSKEDMAAVYAEAKRILMEEEDLPSGMPSGAMWIEAYRHWASARVNARLPAPAAAPVAECEICEARKREGRTNWYCACGHSTPVCAECRGTIKPAAPVALDMSPEDAARLEEDREWISRTPVGETGRESDLRFLLRLLTDAHAREAKKDNQFDYLLGEFTKLQDAVLRAPAGSTGTVELTEEERETIADMDRFKYMRDFITPPLPSEWIDAAITETLKYINRRTRPAASAGDDGVT